MKAHASSRLVKPCKPHASSRLNAFAFNGKIFISNLFAYLKQAIMINIEYLVSFYVSKKKFT